MDARRAAYHDPARYTDGKTNDVARASQLTVLREDNDYLCTLASMVAIINYGSIPSVNMHTPSDWTDIPMMPIKVEVKDPKDSALKMVIEGAPEVPTEEQAGPAAVALVYETGRLSQSLDVNCVPTEIGDTQKELTADCRIRPDPQQLLAAAGQGVFPNLSVARISAPSLSVNDRICKIGVGYGFDSPSSRISIMILEPILHRSKPCLSVEEAIERWTDKFSEFPVVHHEDMEGGVPGMSRRTPQTPTEAEMEIMIRDVMNWQTSVTSYVVACAM